MNRKFFLPAFFSIALLVAAVTSARQAQTTNLQVPNSARASQPSGKPKTPEIPASVLYRHLFHHIVSLNNRAIESQARGVDGNRLTALYKNAAKLSTAENDALNGIAVDCVAKLEQIEARMKPFIDKQREHALVTREGQEPFVPMELQALQLEHDAVIMNAREQVRKSFGNSEFNRFEGFLHQTFKTEIKKASDRKP